MWIQSITTALAVLGAVLGVMNAWRNWVHDRVNVRVLASGGSTTYGEPTICITVRNLSRFAVTIDGVSFSRADGRHTPVNLLPGHFMDQGALPKRLESRTSLAVFVPLSALPSNYQSVFTDVRCNTACGFVFRSGTTPWWRRLVPAAT